MRKGAPLQRGGMTTSNDKRKLRTDLPLMSDDEGNVVLFHPFIPNKAKEYVCDTLSSRWIGQGPKVERFEQAFKEAIGSEQSPISVGAGTDALHLAYVLAGIQPGDEVVTPVFTCTATNIPLAHMGAIIRFADVQPDICASASGPVTDRIALLIWSYSAKR